MTQYPPNYSYPPSGSPPPGYPPPPVGYGTPPPRRPTSVLVIAIIGIIYSALILLCMPIALVGLFAGNAANDPQALMLQENRGLFTYMLISTIVSLVLGVCLLAGSIGAIMLKSWARSLLMMYAGVAAVVVAINIVVTLGWIIPGTIETVDRSTPQGQGYVVGTYVGACGGAAIPLILPILIFTFFTRPHVKAAFEGVETYPYGNPYTRGPTY